MTLRAILLPGVLGAVLAFSGCGSFDLPASTSTPTAAQKTQTAKQNTDVKQYLRSLARAQELHLKIAGVYTQSLDDLAAADPSLIKRADDVNKLGDFSVVLLSDKHTYRIDADLRSGQQISLLRALDGKLIGTIFGCPTDTTAKSCTSRSWDPQSPEAAAAPKPVAPSAESPADRDRPGVKGDPVSGGVIAP